MVVAEVLGTGNLLSVTSASIGELLAQKNDAVLTIATLLEPYNSMLLLLLMSMVTSCCHVRLIFDEISWQQKGQHVSSC